MATYTYECEKCEQRFEATQSVHDDPLTKCTLGKCKGKVKRIVVPGTSFRIGGAGVHKPTSMFNVSNDPGRRR
jgi:putative FmdB family regulatory protein